MSDEPVIRVHILLTSCTSDRTMDVYSNTFCAGGNVLGNGTWVIFGGNQRKHGISYRSVQDLFFLAQLSRQVVSPLPTPLLTATPTEEVPSE